MTFVHNLILFGAIFTCSFETRIYFKMDGSAMAGPSNGAQPFVVEELPGPSGLVDLNSSDKHPVSMLKRTKSSSQEDRHRYKVLINSNILSSKMEIFWKNTGLSPPDPHLEAHKFLLSSDMLQNLFHIGSLPHNGFTQVRIHWMLDLIQMKVLPGYRMILNFKYLDELIEVLKKSNLYPGFELMGNPSKYFTDFENETQVYMWKYLIESLAVHYIGLFGLEYVMKWNFETWNEPDHHDFDGLNFTIKGFLNYYDACSEGLRRADNRLRFGGPGGSCHVPSVGYSPICWALLHHCAYGKNFFSGEIGVRLDFISFHKKGNASSLSILKEELRTIRYVKKKFHPLHNVTYYNDEADPMKNWAKSESWRADSFYAAIVVKILLQHIEQYFINSEKNETKFGLLSNDNAFLSYYPFQFNQRTLLARFQINNTLPSYTEFVKKPVYTVFGLLSKMCPYVLDSKIINEERNWLLSCTTVMTAFLQT